MKPRKETMLGMLIALALVPLAAPVVVADGGNSLEFVALDSDCPAKKQMCFEITEGHPADLEPGATVKVHFLNKGFLEHEWMVTALGNADANHKNTDHDVGLASIHAVKPGREANATFVVPSNAEGLYFWCAVSGHESSGMWTEAKFGEEDLEVEGGTGGNAPTPAWFFVPAIALAALFLRGRPQE